jgi:hypothetical protein
MMRPTHYFFFLCLVCTLSSVWGIVSLNLSSLPTVQIVGSQISPTLTVTSVSPVNATLSISAPSFVQVNSVQIRDTDFIGAGPYFASYVVPHSFTDIGIASVSYTAGPVSLSRTFDVVSGLEPSVILSLNNTGSSLLLTVQTDVSATCKFDYVSGSYADLAYTISSRSSSNKTHTYLITDIFAKTYTLYVACMNTKTSVFMNIPAEISYSVDLQTPRILGHSPYQKSGDSLLVSLDISEPATCRYGLSDLSFSSLPFSFGSSYAQTLSTSMDLSYADASVFIRCADVAGNVMNSSYVIVYKQDSPATARIEVEDASDDYLGAGLYDLTLFTTKALRVEPRLQLVYVLDGSAKSIIVPLEKRSSVSWSGQLYIPESEFHGIAYFEFSATDIDGLSSTQITDGSSLKISTKIPPTPSTPQVTTSNAQVLIRFDYPRFDFLSHYLIQKKSVDDPSFTSRYTSDVREFIDTSVIPGESYWYSIIAVSRSGTYSLASEPVKIVVSKKDPVASINDSSTSVSSSSYVMPDFLSGNLVTAQLDLEKTALQLSDKSIDYGSFESLGIKSKNAQLIKQAQTVLTQSQKKVYTSNKDVSETISSLLEQTRQLKQQFVSQLSIIEQTTTTTPISEGLLESAFSQALSAKRIVGDVDTNSLLKYARKLTSQYPVSININKVQLTYESGASELYTVFEFQSEYVGDGELVVSIPSEYTSLFHGQTSVLGSPVFIGKDIPVVLYATSAVPSVKQQLLQGFILPPITYTGEGFGVGNFILGSITSASMIYYILGFICIVVLTWFYFKPISSDHSSSSSIKPSVLQSMPTRDDEHPVTQSNSRSWLSVVSGVFDRFSTPNSQTQTSQQLHHSRASHMQSVPRVSTDLAHTESSGDSVQTAQLQSSEQSVVLPSSFVVDAVSQTQRSVVHSSSNSASNVLPTPSLQSQQISSMQSPTIVAIPVQTLPEYGASSIIGSNRGVTASQFVQPTARFFAHQTPLGYHAVPSHVAFVTRDGKKLHSLIDLAFALSHMSDQTFSHHVNNHTHDFAHWIKDVFGYTEFAWHIKQITDRQQLSDTIYSFSQYTTPEYHSKQ